MDNMKGWDTLLSIAEMAASQNKNKSIYIPSTHLVNRRLKYIERIHGNSEVMTSMIETDFLREPVAINLDNGYHQKAPVEVPLTFDVPFPPPENTEFTFIDLFAGIGGFRIPLQTLNGKCVFTSEFNLHAQKAYHLNFGEMPHGDITQIDLNEVPHHDILTAGFPCQPFSISGKMRGFEDTRGTLIYRVFQIIKKREPKVIFLENVKHLVHHDSGKTLRTILRHLEELGYVVSCEVLNASDFGVPQNRERIIIIGHKSKKFDFSRLAKSPRVRLADFLDTRGEFDYLKETYTIISEHKLQPSEIGRAHV